MSCEFYISDYAKTKVLQFPTIPSELPQLSSDGKNEEFETYWDIPYNFIEKRGLLQLSWDSWLPVDYTKYYFVKSKVNGKEIIDLIEKAKKNTEPIFLTITKNGEFYVNGTFSVEKFEYSVLKRGDFKYSLGLKEWRGYTTTITTTTYTVGWQQDSTGWYYYTDTSGNYYSDSWQLIDNEWYSFDSQGYARQSVWLQDGGVYYYLKDNCKMARNETLSIDSFDYTFDSTGSWIES